MDRKGVDGCKSITLGCMETPKGEKIKGVNSWCWGVKTISGCKSQLKLRVIYDVVQ
jgi:hypothetical protein